MASSEVYQPQLFSNSMQGRYGNVFFVLVLTTAAAVFYFGFESYERLTTLRKTVEIQRNHNDEQRELVSSLQKDVVGLQTDNRILEKAARNELGMSRPQEMVIIFNERKP